MHSPIKGVWIDVERKNEELPVAKMPSDIVPHVILDPVLEGIGPKTIRPLSWSAQAAYNKHHKVAWPTDICFLQF